jgi:hypothetical protein
MWTDQKLQTVSINTGLKYFRVRCKDNTVNSDDDQMIERLLQRAKEREEESIDRDELIKEKEGPGEESPWLARTGWKRMFMGRNMQEMVRHTVTEDNLEPELAAIKKGVDRVIERCMKSVQDLDVRDWNEVRFWLRSHKNGVPHEKPFRRPLTKLEKYKRIWTRLIVFCWRTFEMEDVGAEFLDRQRNEIRRLRESICLDSVHYARRNSNAILSGGAR